MLPNWYTAFRSSHLEVFLRQNVLNICSKFTGEHSCQSVISAKLFCNFIEITLRHGCSPVNLLHTRRTPFPKNTSGGLLLSFSIRTSKFCLRLGVLNFFRIWDWDVFNLFGSGRPEVFYKKDVLSNFAKFTRKHRCQSLLLNKVVGLRSATLLRRRLWHRYFPVNFAYFLRTPFLHNTFGASKLSLLISGVPVLILMTFWNYKTAFKRIQNKNGIMSMSTNYINSY